MIGETAEIGNDVTLYHGVTLGGTTWNQTKRHPTLGDNVLIGAGAKILGAITLGNNVRVGANSVVIKDVPACCTVIGIPGRIIQQKGVKILNPNGIDLDHHLVPDPVGKAITCLTDRLDKLEADQEKLLQVADACATCEAETVCHGEDTVLGKQAHRFFVMDLLDFEAKDLYFEREDPQEVQELIKFASERYASGEAELPLLKAYLRAPESLNVLVALNRFYYYQHRLQEALLVSEKALAIIRSGIDFPENWQTVGNASYNQCTERFTNPYQTVFIHAEVSWVPEYAHGKPVAQPKHFRKTGRAGQQGSDRCKGFIGAGRQPSEYSYQLR